MGPQANAADRKIVEWLQLGLALLGQTAVVTLCIAKIYSDVDYLKQFVAESKADRAAIRQDIKALGVFDYRLDACSKRLEELHLELSKHVGEKQ